MSIPAAIGSSPNETTTCGLAAGIDPGTIVAAGSGEQPAALDARLPAQDSHSLAPATAPAGPVLSLWLRPLTAVLASSLVLAIAGIYGAPLALCPHPPQQQPVWTASTLLPEWVQRTLVAAESAIGLSPSAAATSTMATVLLLLLPFWVARGALAAISLPLSMNDGLCPSEHSSARDSRLRACTLSLAAAALSALACINWALAYAAALLLLLLAYLAWPKPVPPPQRGARADSTPTPLTGPSGSAPSFSSVCIRAVALAVLSPPSMLCTAGLMSLLTSRGAAGAPQPPEGGWFPLLGELGQLPGAMLALQCESHVAVLWVFWGLYLPVWVLCAGTD